MNQFNQKSRVSVEVVTHLRDLSKAGLKTLILWTLMVSRLLKLPISNLIALEYGYSIRI